MFGFILWLAGQAVNYSQNAQRDEEANRSRDQKQPEESLWAPTTWALITIFTLALVVVGGGQAALFLWQLGLIREGAADAKTAAEAAKTSAEAALASLERPWLVFENLKQNRRDWPNTGRVNVMSSFTIANYGKVPAFIYSMKVKTFLSHLKNTPVNDEDWPEKIIPFPPSETFTFFVHDKGLAPFRKRDGDALAGLEVHEPIEFNVPMVIGSGGTSGDIFAREFYYATVIRPGAISMEALCQLHLVGTLTYSGPRPGMETITFCFRETRDGGFQAVGGPPYNQNHQNQWRGMPT